MESAGAKIDREMHPLESDWLFSGLHDDKKFTVVLVVIKFSPCTWFVAMEGATPTEEPDRNIRLWAQPILEKAVRRNKHARNLCWHDTHLTLPKPND